jgi:hypothetical protein
MPVLHLLSDQTPPRLILISAWVGAMLAVWAEMGNSIFFCWLTRILNITSLLIRLTRDPPVALLQEYINFTGKPIRFLRVHTAKEFTCPAMVDLCNANNIILQVVVSYKHLVQARVEGAIGICKQHTRVALAVANAPVRFLPAALTDFRHTRNFLWSSKGAKGQISTSHERLSPVFTGTSRKVAVPFCLPRH